MLALILLAQTWIPITSDSVVIVRHDEPPQVSHTSQGTVRTNTVAAAARFFRAPKPGPSYTYGDLVRGELVDGERITPQSRYWTGTGWSTSQPPARYVYNIWRARANWSFPGPRTKANLINHLMGRVGARGHVGKFEESKLRTLSYQSLDNLHSNDHEGRPYTLKGAAGARTAEAPLEKQLGNRLSPNSSRTFCPT